MSIQKNICHIIKHAIAEDLPDLHSYNGKPIERESSDAITAKQNEFWSLVDKNEALKNLLTGDCDKRNEVLSQINDDEALLLLSKYHMDKGL